jgi:hypothetical protein
MDLLLLQSERAFRSCIAAHCRHLEALSASSETCPERREEAAALARELQTLGLWTDSAAAPSAGAMGSKRVYVLKAFSQRLLLIRTDAARSGQGARAGGSVRRQRGVPDKKQIADLLHVIERKT